MSILDCIYQLIIGPLKLLFEFIFVKANLVFNNPGLAIIFLSLAMNILVLPLYRRADKMQEEVKNQEKSLEPWVSHIKKTFSGDEKMMMLSTYYRQREYKPIYALKGSLSLFLEIPFFIAAYSFLSELELLKGVSFGVISDLGSQDQLISIMGLSVNLLPILMTAINAISAAIYLKGFPVKNKIQMYGIAVIFLIFLYNSPSGLVFYWTLNNLFSLIKNIFYKLKNPALVLKILFSVTGIFFAAIIFLVHPFSSIKVQIIIITFCFLLQIPLLLTVISNKFVHKSINFPEISAVTKTESRIFLACCVFMTLLLGALIPSAIINDSTSEFVNFKIISAEYEYTSPLWFVMSALMYAAGTFMVWFNIFYHLASPELKKFFSYIMFMFSGTALVNYLFFGTNYGNMSPLLVYDTPPSNSLKECFINCIVLIAVAFVLFLIFRKKANVSKIISCIMCVAVLGMSLFNVVGIQSNLSKGNKILFQDKFAKVSSIPLSTKSKNIVVIMLDRAIGYYFPYLINEKPELKKQFAGFTYYPNTVSFGTRTNIAMLEVFGGYDYIPQEINKRDDISLSQKTNEAIKLMPAVFSKIGFDVTVGNPTYAGYTDEIDLSIFNDMKNVNAFKTSQKTTSEFDVTEELEYVQFRNFFPYGIFKTLPLFIQDQAYMGGDYWTSKINYGEGHQTINGLSKAIGLSKNYLQEYDVMNNLINMTTIEQSDNNTYFSLCNNLTHEPTLLQMPDYTLSQEVDNTDYDSNHKIRYSDDGASITFDEVPQITHYHVNMQAFMLLGKWFDYLRENNVYDNTRIILVSDHGASLGIEECMYGDHLYDDALRYSSILLVKDFNSKYYREDKRFMTNADVPSLAFKDVVKNPVNPYTGKSVNSNYKDNADEITVYDTVVWQVSKNTGNKLSLDYEAKVNVHNDDIFNPKNWTYIRGSVNW